MSNKQDDSKETHRELVKGNLILFLCYLERDWPSVLIKRTSERSNIK